MMAKYCKEANRYVQICVPRTLYTRQRSDDKNQLKNNS